MADVVLPFPSFKLVTSVDVDRKTGEIYWTDTAEDTIQKGTPDGKNMDVLIMHEMEAPDGIAIDSTGRKVLLICNRFLFHYLLSFRCTGPMGKEVA